MINDMAEIVTDVELSLFADDSSVYRSGRKLATIIDDIQRALDHISDWCDDWGLQISLKKSTIVIFTHRVKYEAKPIIYKGEAIKVEEKVKFLGMIFDKRLNWRSHTQYIVDRCAARLNLMRSLAGAGWGASKTALLAVYRALIRSLLDYGAEALDSASHGILAKFDSIQYRALKICCGAMAGTALEALQGECGELPLALRRRRQQLRHSVKILATPDHPASSVLRDHWTNHYGKYSRTIYDNVKDFFGIYGWNTPAINLKPDEDPPWSKDPFYLDCSLSRVLRKSDPESNSRALALNMISEYSDRLHVYTDGSKDEEGRVACAVCVPEKSVQVKLRLSDNLSVFTAELAAIRKALELARDYRGAGESRNIVVFSDSLSSIQSLDSSRPHNRPDILKDLSKLKKSLGNTVTIAWIPSHVGIRGNEEADRLAKEALKHASIDAALLPDQKETYDAIDKYINQQWQDSWESFNTSKHNKRIQPLVNNKVKVTDPNRRKEVQITRLRLGVCQLKHYLKIQKNHPTGLCSTCGVPETIEHYLMYCRESQIFSKLQELCSSLKVPFNLQTILNNKTTLNKIYENLAVWL
jgi:ribonuclease HI